MCRWGAVVMAGWYRERAAAEGKAAVAKAQEKRGGWVGRGLSIVAEVLAEKPGAGVAEAAEVVLVVVMTAVT